MEVNKVVSVTFDEILSEIVLKNLLTKVTLPENFKFAQAKLVNPEKLVSIPTQQTLFLRFVIDSAKITEERKRSINSFVRISF